jgi:hypothetical protein
MPIKTQIWTVNSQPIQLKECTLSSEQLLEDMIVSAPDASLVLIEPKSDRTPREVVA